MSVTAAVPSRASPARRLFARLGPGLITGAADDDPSGIATYAQAGAAFGYQLGWTVVLTLPLMVAVQETSAWIGRVTAAGLGAALRRHAPRPVLLTLILLLLAANIVNLAADLGAMAEAARMLVGGGPAAPWTLGFALFCAGTEIWISYRAYTLVLKWLTLALGAYLALLAVVDVPWATALSSALVPRLDLTRDALTTVLAVLGTTISPYLFFWQAAEEAEDEAAGPDRPPLRAHPEDAPPERRRIAWDTWGGMTYSNAVALAVIFGTAATLHAHGVNRIDTGPQAAALAPIAGRFASAVFALGMIGTGLLAVPVLAGSAAYAVSEGLGWVTGLGRSALEARGFYAIIAVATLMGAAVVFSPLDPMRALFWSAVVNGAIAAPMIVAMVVLGSRRAVMGPLLLPGRLRAAGLLTAALMAAATVGMVIL